jgi:hypothetical protein
MTIPILGQGGSQPADQGKAQEIKDDGPQLRIFYCWNCKTIDELPDFQGRPEDDDLLAILVERHQSAGVPHGCTPFRIGVKTWSNTKIREAIIKKIKSETNGGLDDLDPGYYATRSMFYEDAMKCYSLHNRPHDSCFDYKDEKKRLVPQTDALRKEVGLTTSAKSNATKVYLCDFCPVKSVVMTKARKAAGMYNE